MSPKAGGDSKAWIAPNKKLSLGISDEMRNPS